MTALAGIIRRQIAADGPMSLHDYMALCLGHPEHGYYTTRDPLGAGGDFTTAPEISQMFGEMVGLALAQAWVDQGRPAKFYLVELGPGRGTLIDDAIRAAGAAPGFTTAADLWLVETSQPLRDEQMQRVPMAADWAFRLEEVPDDAPLFLIANEFFDALPIRQYVRKDGQWRERVVGLKDDALIMGLGKVSPVFAPAPEGAVRERCPAGEAIAAETGARIARHGGAAILIDYGYDRIAPTGADTFQALHDHAFADPLVAPGDADLTAHVDFTALACAAAPARTTKPVGQGEWLARLGLGARAQTLLEAKPDEAQRIADALHRLTDPSEMGTLFKAMALHQRGAPPPPGFETGS